MDHFELIQEMVLLEKMTAQERLKHARKRRQQQLKSWTQRETINQTNGTIPTSIKSPSKTRKISVKFPENIVILEATARQDFDEVRQLLQSGLYSPNTANEDGLTPIHQCSIDNSEKILKLLIEYGGNVNARDRDLWTPLHAAATCGHVQICRILVTNGAELLALNADGNMPYDICDDEITLDYIETQMDRVGITQEMIDKTRSQIETQMLRDLENLVEQNSFRTIDDKFSYRNSDGATLLHIASANGYQTVLDFLLKQHISINLQDKDGWMPIHAAAFWCQQTSLKLLIEAGADIHEKIPDGRSALDLCDDPELRSFMIENREQNIRNQEKAAAAAAAVAAAAAQSQIKPNNRLHVNSNTLPNGTSARIGTLYESRSSVSSPYGSGSSLNRTSSIRRASIRDREKVKKLNENFLDVLQAKDKIQEDIDEIPQISTNKLISKDEQTNSSTTATDSTIKESLTISPSITPKIEITLPPLKVPLPLPPTQTTSDTLSDVKRRREERRRGVGISTTNLPQSATSPPPLTDINQKFHTNNSTTKISNGIDHSLQRYTSPKHIEIHNHHMLDPDHEKRICCTIL